MSAFFRGCELPHESPSVLSWGLVDPASEMKDTVYDLGREGKRERGRKTGRMRQKDGSREWEVHGVWECRN